MKGIKNFRNKDNGLRGVHVDTIAGLVFVNFSEEEEPPISLEEHCGVAMERLTSHAGEIESLIFVERKVYSMPCNWKVFVDNYCDGGYHVPYAHADLAESINMDTYTREIFPYASSQIVAAQDGEAGGEAAGGDRRVGQGACYNYHYPTLMLNRYGPWLDTNTVVPTGVDSCDVILKR